jgi:hypothetical protein
MGELAERMTYYFFDISDASKPKLLVALSLAIGLLVAWLRTLSIDVFLIFGSILAASTYFMTNWAIKKEIKPGLKTVGSILLVLIILNGWQELGRDGEPTPRRGPWTTDIIDDERIREQVRRAERNNEECMRDCRPLQDFPASYKTCVEGCYRIYEIMRPK